mmetsp:Transcript_26567/g.65794  ORF Transcript_26567/g.65794 Transcript_26567/m.65794 type:complete len:126 (-) Transcript_26567:51-428(-)|eukprot:2544123-Prymnesium_polylepis.1
MVSRHAPTHLCWPHGLGCSRRRPQFESGARSLGAALKIAEAMATEAGKEELHALFKTLDKNSDGTVSSKEWGSAVSRNKELLAKYFGGSSVAEIGQAFKRLDTDKSGDLSWAEFTAGCERFLGPG